jgi:hypothetical protein
MSIALVVLAAAMPQLPMSHSQDSSALYSELRTYNWGCPKDDEANKKKEVAHVAAVASKISDDFDRGQFVDYATKLKAWFDENDAGIPGLGSWDEIAKRYRAARAAFDALPPQAPTGSDAVRAAIAIYTAIHAQNKGLRSFWSSMGNTPCMGYPGDWGVLVHDGEQADYAAGEQVKDGSRPALDAYHAWKDSRAILDEAAPTTYWEQLENTGKLIDLVIATQALVPKLADLAAWSPLLESDDATVASGAAAEADATITAAAQRAAAQLPDVKMAPLPKDAGRAKLVKKMLASQDGGSEVGGVVGPKGTSKESWTEDLEVRRDSEYVYTKTYAYTREYYSTYYVWKPSTPPAVTLPGIEPADVCEVWHQSFYRFTKGGPNVKDEHKWGPYQSWKEGYVLCKNAGVTSKLKIKK